MISFKDEQIKEIAEQLDFGFKCFWNKKTGELIFITDESSYPEMEMEGWADEIDKLDEQMDDFIEIERLSSRESFEIMEESIDTLPNTITLKANLIFAINKKKPFQHFKFVIDNSGPFRKAWFQFKDQKMLDWVRNKIDEIKYLDEHPFEE